MSWFRRKRILKFPALRQAYGFDCGASATQSCGVYLGIEEREDKILEELKTTTADMYANGAKLYKIKAWFDKRGVPVRLLQGMNARDIVRAIDDGHPVILLIQAWTDSDKPDWKSDFDDGHYVTAIGYDRDRIIFEDPSLFNRDWLTADELSDRWHDLMDDQKTPAEHVGIVIMGERKYDPRALFHMD
jgi:hypothetical protein